MCAGGGELAKSNRRSPPDPWSWGGGAAGGRRGAVLVSHEEILAMYYCSLAGVFLLLQNAPICPEAEIRTTVFSETSFAFARRFIGMEYDATTILENRGLTTTTRFGQHNSANKFATLSGTKKFEERLEHGCCFVDVAFIKNKVWARHFLIRFRRRFVKFSSAESHK